MTTTHLLTLDGMERSDIEDVLDLADEFVEVLARDIPKVPALRGKIVATLFFEPSTRTRLSFEAAAKALSADTMSFAPGTSAVTKGESLKDTVQTLEAMGADLMVVRHEATGAAWRVASWVGVPVVNGGDGAHQHPTQGLLDALTLRHRFGKLDGLQMAVVGDIRHSRVARSLITACTTLGARVTLVGPPTLLPLDMTGWPVEVSGSLDDVIGDLDAIYMLRVQAERGGTSMFPSLPEYVARFGVDRARFERLRPDAVVLHPGPINRGVELSPEVADDQRSLILPQVANGVAVRMAVLFRLLGDNSG